MKRGMVLRLKKALMDKVVEVHEELKGKLNRKLACMGDVHKGMTCASMPWQQHPSPTMIVLRKHTMIDD